MKRFGSFVVIGTALLAMCDQVVGQDVKQPDEFLDRLAGSWTLTGTMGSTLLNQKVEAEWVLQNTFVQMHFVGEAPHNHQRPPYEAIYLLGYDGESDEYVIHLFDTFGVGYSRTIGVGRRIGDSVEFIFDYPSGVFSNTFTWREETGEWKMLLRQPGQDGTWTIFATKTLRPDDR